MLKPKLRMKPRKLVSLRRTRKHLLTMKLKRLVLQPRMLKIKRRTKKLLSELQVKINKPKMLTN